ncbi:alpha/beta hydrolase [Actinocorallia aurea]
MRRRALMASASLAAALCLGAGSALAVPPPVPSAAADAAARLPAQKLSWAKCFPNAAAKYARLQCARVKVPRDWAHPNGKKITLVVSRLKARKQPKGVLFTNPGGPGAAGLLTPLLFVDAGRARLMDYQDIIGFDPRGTGSSAQSLCQELPAAPPDARDRSAAGTARLLAYGAKLAKACRNGGGLPSRYVTTAQTVRDLEYVRRSLRTSKGGAVKKINWLGYSAGTWLGAHYAAAYPNKAGRFVLDSVVRFTGSWQQHNYLQPVGFQRRFAEDFAPWAAKYDGEFGLGGTAAAVLARYEEVRAAIGGLGGIDVETVDGYTFTLYPGDLDDMIASSIYTKYQFAFLATDLSTLSDAVGDPAARRLPVRLHSAVDPTTSEIATFFATQCNDTAFSGTPAQHAAKTERIGKAHPLIGYSVISDPCAAWQRSAGPRLKRPGKGLPRMLMIQSRNDPATPYEGAVQAHERFANSRLVTVRDEGDHGLYASGNACVDRVVDAYLIDGAYPRVDRSCAGRPIPAPEPLRTTPSANPLQHLKELEDVLKPA